MGYNIYKYLVRRSGSNIYKYLSTSFKRLADD